MFLFTTPTSREAAPAGTPVIDAIRQGAERTGVGFDYLLATAQRESALDPKAQARGSSASGLFQFVEQTWLAMVKSEGGKAGLSDYSRAISTRSDGTYSVEDPSLRRAILDLRQDPGVASVMAGALTQKNREALTADLGRAPTGGELYVAHFLGARGASDLIKAASSNPSRPIASDFPEAAAANRSIFYDSQGRARGAGEVYALLTANASGSAAAAMPAADRPGVAVRQDGPAFYGLFQTGGRTGPISDTVAKLWRTGRQEAGQKVAALSYFPSSRSVPEPEPAPEAAPVPDAPRTAQIPLPPRRPDRASSTDTAKPLDLSAFMRARKT
jgi:hypothetical protein